jgi:hypothetical protein
MSEAVAIALIVAAQAIVVAFLGVVSVRVGRLGKVAAATHSDAAATREHVVNDHGQINFREESDGRHAETRRWFRTLNEGQRALQRDVGGMREDIRGLAQSDRNMDGRLQRVEAVLMVAAAERNTE